MAVRTPSFQLRGPNLSLSWMGVQVVLSKMTTLNPTHNPLREPKGRHAQAIHEASQFPDDLPAEDDQSIDQDGHHTSKVKREARRRVRAQMPPMPDLRFEQVHPLSRDLAGKAERRVKLNALVILAVDSTFSDTATDEKGGPGTRYARRR